MTQILIDVTPDTITHLHEMTALYPKLTIAQLAGQYLDTHVAYQLEVEKMRPRPIKYYTPEFLSHPMTHLSQESGDGAPVDHPAQRIPQPVLDIRDGGR